MLQSFQDALQGVCAFQHALQGIMHAMHHGIMTLMDENGWSESYRCGAEQLIALVQGRGRAKRLRL